VSGDGHSHGNGNGRPNDHGDERSGKNGQGNVDKAKYQLYLSVFFNFFKLFMLSFKFKIE
jgi:hypothetical protein